VAEPLKQTVGDFRGLREEDLSLLGDDYVDDFDVHFEETGDRLRIVPPESLWRPLKGMALLSLVVYAGFCLALFFGRRNAIRLGDEEPSLVIDLVIIVSLILGAVLAIAAPVYAHLSRLRYLKSISPLVEFDRGTSRISILAGADSFHQREVFCLLLVSNARTGHDLKSEMQLVIDGAQGRERHLLMASIWSYGESFRDAAKEFARAAGIKLLKAGPKEQFLGRGPMEVREG